MSPYYSSSSILMESLKFTHYIEPFSYGLPVYTIFDETDILVHASMFRKLLSIAIEAVYGASAGSSRSLSKPILYPSELMVFPLVEQLSTPYSSLNQSTV